MSMTKKEQRLRRSRQTRLRIAQQGTARLAVHRSNLHIYAAMRGQSLEDFQKTRNAPGALYSVAGKERLQKRLTDAINKVLTEREGFGGVDAVYFKTFIIQ